MISPSNNPDYSLPEDSPLNKLTDEQLEDLYHKLKTLKVNKPGRRHYYRESGLMYFARYASTNYPDIHWIEFVSYKKHPPYVFKKAFFKFDWVDNYVFYDLSGKGEVNL